MMADEVEVERVGAVTTCLRPSLSTMECRVGRRGWFDVDVEITQESKGLQLGW